MVEDITLKSAAKLLPLRAPGAHKGHFGHTLVIAGARGFVGAAKLATEGALRSGTGLVTLAVPEGLLDVAATGLSEAMTAPLPETIAGGFAVRAVAPATKLAAKRDAVVLGPGLTTADEVARFVEGFLRLGGDAPLVLDADGLNCIAEGGDESRAALRGCARPMVLTPHPGEAARLLNTTNAAVQADREAAAQALVGLDATFALGAAVAVLKGHHTLVAASDGRIARNTSGSHGLAKGGSGDVLAGLIGGLLAQGMKPFEAACLGVYVHGLAGDLAQAKHGARAMLARDVLAALGEAWMKLEAAA